MSMRFTIRSKMLLTIMAVWIFLSLAAGGCFNCPSCCDKGTEEVKGEIIKCYEQKRGLECDRNFYIVVIKGDKHFCINPNSQWLKKKREQEGLSCS